MILLPIDDLDDAITIAIAVHKIKGGKSTGTVPDAGIEVPLRLEISEMDPLLQLHLWFKSPTRK